VIASPQANEKRRILLSAFFQKAFRKKVGNKMLLLFPDDNRSAAWREFSFPLTRVQGWSRN